VAPVPVIADPRFVLGRELVQVGEPSVGRALMRDLLSDRGGRPYDSLAAAEAFGDLGLFDLQVSAVGRLLSQLNTAQLLSAPPYVLTLAYPLPYDDSLQSAAALGRVPQLLLAALVRQESAWDAQAVSSADAVGLTQVTEPTGRQIAAALGRPWMPEMLLVPSTALEFGAYYLGEQLAHFDGNLAAAIAAYNGGPGSAARWLNAQPIPGVDGFLIAIDFQETQRFVDRVLENYAWYRYVYGRAAAPALP
jgi:soluble lytic murein transglycosylase